MKNTRKRQEHVCESERGQKAICHTGRFVQNSHVINNAECLLVLGVYPVSYSHVDIGHFEDSTFV